MLITLYPVMETQKMGFLDCSGDDPTGYWHASLPLQFKPNLISFDKVMADCRVIVMRPAIGIYQGRSFVL